MKKGIKMLTKENISELIQMQKRFSELYHEGLTSIHSNNIHLDSSAFIRLFGDKDAIHKDRDISDYPHEYSFVYDGVEFFCISKERIRELEKQYDNTI